MRNYISFWKGLYQQHDNPELYHPETNGEPPTREEIEAVIRALPNKKAPGPDGIAAELLKKGSTMAVEMTVALVQHVWETKDVPT